MDTIRKYSCPLEVTIAAIGGKWKCLILWWLRRDARRFSELKLLIPYITPKILTQQLRELEQEGLIYRESYPESPPRVERKLPPSQLTEALARATFSYFCSRLTGYNLSLCLTGACFEVIAPIF